MVRSEGPSNDDGHGYVENENIICQDQKGNAELTATMKIVNHASKKNI